MLGTAGKLAGLTVLRMVVEPSAAALAYSIERERRDLLGSGPGSGCRRVLVYDLGGGTFDVAVATVMGCRVTVRGTGGHSHLGGQDFDRRVFNHIAQVRANGNP